MEKESFSFDPDEDILFETAKRYAPDIKQKMPMKINIGEKHRSAPIKI